MADLPDFYGQFVEDTVMADSLDHGVDSAKSATPNAGDIYWATDTKKLYICAVDGTWIDYETTLNAISGSAPSRALDTIYQNTSDKITVVTVVIANSGTLGNNADSADCQIGTASPPTTTVATISTTNPDQIGAGLSFTGWGSGRSTASATFLVPPDYYYRVAKSLGNAGLLTWYEWELH